MSRRTKRVVTAMLGGIAALSVALAGVSMAQAAVGAAEFEPEPGSVTTVCGWRWWAGHEYVRRCGQASAGYGRTGYYHSSTNRGTWDTWRRTVSACVIDREVVAGDGRRGEFIGFPQFRRASDGHVLTHGTQLVKRTGGADLRLGYYDHREGRFHVTAWVRDVDPHLYPTNPKPSVCSVPR